MSTILTLQNHRNKPSSALCGLITADVVPFQDYVHGDATRHDKIATIVRQILQGTNPDDDRNGTDLGFSYYSAADISLLVQATCVEFPNTKESIISNTRTVLHKQQSDRPTKNDASFLRGLMQVATTYLLTGVDSRFAYSVLAICVEVVRFGLMENSECDSVFTDAAMSFAESLPQSDLHGINLDELLLATEDETSPLTPLVGGLHEKLVEAFAAVAIKRATFAQKCAGWRTMIQTSAPAPAQS